jgi:hypothetical protein
LPLKSHSSDATYATPEAEAAALNFVLILFSSAHPRNVNHKVPKEPSIALRFPNEIEEDEVEDETKRRSKNHLRKFSAT